MSAAALADLADDVTPGHARDRWAWITGGEPTDHDLRPLIAELKQHRFSVCVASSGEERFAPPIDWLSISPHSMNLKQLYGNEVKLVPGLNGMDPWEWAHEFDRGRSDFWYKYVQPLEVDGVEVNLDDCLRFLEEHPNWSLSRQDHKYWGKP